MRYPISLALAAIVIVSACTNFQEEEVPVSFGVNLSELSYDTASSLRPVVVSSGTKWTVASMPAWMSLQSINPSGRSPYEWTASFMAEANDGYNREGRIVINAKGESAEIAVTQDGKKGKYVAVESVSISPSTLTLTEGESSTLTYTISPSNASEKGVTWKSSSPSVATVSESGKVEALAVGTTTITVTTEDGGKTASCSMTVQSAKVSVTGVSLNKSSLSMTVGDSETLTATVLPSNATDKSVTWASSKTEVATVSSIGVVAAKSAGTATITVTTTDGAKTATCSVTVKEATVSVTRVSLNKSSLSMTVGDTETLTATVTPSNATDKSVTWKSSNTAVATVSSSGIVTAKAAGTATITVTTTDGSKTATCSVTVKEATVSVTGVNLSKSSLTMNVGDTEPLTATVLPTNATDKSVTWSSSKNSVATVSSSGVVTAKAAGTATITVTTTDGSKTATCTVTVKAAKVSVTGVSLDKSSMIMEVGDIKALIASVTPLNATDKSVMWFSSNDSIATVTSDGVVTAKEVGTAAITVKTNDGGHTAVCTLTINEKTVPVTGISLDKTSLTLVEGGTYHFNVTITPENATNQEIWWSISNESIVNLIYDRGIVALDPGYVTITVGTFDGDQKATCFITVTEAETINGHKFVDLGLPSGLKWASCNIGASNSTELGDKFAWGETSTKTSFSNYNYKWGDGETNDYTMTKYNSEDNRTILELQDDAANANWGGNWRIPTVDDVLELYNNCVIKNIRVNGVNGYIYISNINGNSLFIRSDSIILEDFWTSSLATWNPEAARAFTHIYWKTGLVDDSVLGAVSRYCGLYVRPVSN